MCKKTWYGSDLNALKAGGSEKLILFITILWLGKLKLKFLFNFPNLKQLSCVRTWIELRSPSILLLIRHRLYLILLILWTSFINLLSEMLRHGGGGFGLRKFLCSQIVCLGSIARRKKMIPGECTSSEVIFCPRHIPGIPCLSCCIHLLCVNKIGRGIISWNWFIAQLLYI